MPVLSDCAWVIIQDLKHVVNQLIIQGASITDSIGTMVGGPANLLVHKVLRKDGKVTPSNIFRSLMEVYEHLVSYWLCGACAETL